MRISTHNDWDPLREIIVGRADGARVLTVDASTMNFSYASSPVEQVRELEGPLPQWLIDEANADADRLVAVLERHGVKVHRPLPMDTGVEYARAEWRTTGFFTWSPRDLLLPLGNLTIDCPSPTSMNLSVVESAAFLCRCAIRVRSAEASTVGRWI